jgi:hypothetical protein
MNRKTNKKKATKKKSPGLRKAELHGTALADSTNAVWTGSIGRLRIWDSQTSNGTVFVYKSPGNNSDQVGITTDANIFKALLLARDNGRSVTGFTDRNGRISWVDY